MTRAFQPKASQKRAANGRTSRRLRIKRNQPPSIRPAMPRPQRRDCHGRLAAVIVEVGGPTCHVADASFRPWCSATFIGAQHKILLRIQEPHAHARAQILAEALGESELRLSGHVVVDVAIDDIVEAGPDCVEVVLTVLTVEDW